MTHVAATSTSLPVGLRSRKNIDAFELLQPTSLAQAQSVFGQYPRAAFMAGGIDLIDRMKGGALVDHVICLARVPELSAITWEDGMLTVGAAATHADILTSSRVRDALPDLHGLWQALANPRIRHTGTIGGNLCARQPHYDVAPALAALNATATIITPQGEYRTVPVLELSEHAPLLLHSVQINVLRVTRLFFDRTLHPALALYLGIVKDSDVVTSLNVGIGGAYATPIVHAAPMTRMPTTFFTPSTCADMAAAFVAQLQTPLSDSLCSGAYRLRMIEVQLRRLLGRLAEAV